VLHVPFDELVGHTVVEQRLIDEARRRGKVVVIGRSGSGKSSALSAVFGPLSEQLPEHILPIRIPILLAPVEQITRPLGFARHLLQHVAAWSEQIITRTQQQQARGAAADRTRRTSGGQGLSFRVPIPHHIPVEVGAELRRAAIEIEEGINATSVNNGIEQLLAAFDEQTLEPFFVVDESDTWTSLSGQADAHEIARDFYANVVNWMAREFPCGFVCVAHDEYEQIAAYGNVAQLLRQVRIPVLPDPAVAIAAIVDKRLQANEVEATHRDLFDGSGLAALATRYAATHDMRGMLQLAALAVDLAASNLTVTHISDETIEATRRANAANRSSD
jgi:Cdc6-like AAA superfamily ATPase